MHQPVPLISRLRTDWSLWLYPLAYALASWRIYGNLGLLDNTRVIGGPWSDPVQQTWFLSYWQWAVTHTHVATWTDLMDHPLGINLLDNTSFPLLGILSAPLTSAFGPVAVLGLLFRLAFFLSCLAMFVVLRKLGVSSAAAGIGGLFYGFCPSAVAYGANWMHLVFLPLPPVMLYLLYRGLTDTAQARRYGLQLGAVTVVQCLIESEVALDTLIVAGLTVIVFLLARWIRRSLRREDLERFVRTAGGFAAVAFVPLLALSLLILDGRAAFHWRLFPIHQSGYSPFAVLLPGAGNLVSSLVGIQVPTNLQQPTSAAEIGVPLIIAITVTVVWLRAQPLVRAAAVFALIGWVLSLGAYLTHLNGTLTEVPLPFTVLSRLPLGGNLSPTRFTAFAALGAAVVLALGIDAAIRSRRMTALRLSFAATIALGVALAAPTSALSSGPVAPYAPFEAASPAIQRHIPRGGVVLTLPYSNGGPIESMLWQAIAGMRYKLMGGYAIRQLPPGYPAYGYPELAQTTVACLLMAGPATTRGPTCRSARVVRPQLRSFVRRWHVSAILVQIQPGDGDMLRFLNGLYRSRGHNGSMYVWSTGIRPE